MRKVLVLEDESSIRGFIVINLERAGYEVIEAETGEEALEKLAANPDTRAVLLDIMLPGIDGIEVCRRIRLSDPHIGIIMLSARSQEMDKVTGLMTGADDYITKPFSPAELTARVDALLRRTGDVPPAAPVPEAPGELVQPPFRLNTTNRTLEKNGQRVRLTQVEYAIVKLFMENKGTALSRESILDTVWGHGYFGEPKIVDVNVRRLRIKLEDDAQEPKYILTVWGYGYKWNIE
ncbi:MAG: response regulator transcription factor [Ruminococcaceae bacterium]|nr:response regulator transcription factor [Oscillospiraceae bacterium]